MATRDDSTPPSQRDRVHGDGRDGHDGHVEPSGLGQAMSVELSAEDAALPVVARMVVEIRSDGRRTIARGAMEDVASGERVAVAARGGSPLELALGMAKSIFRAPAIAKSAVRALLPGRRGRK